MSKAPSPQQAFSQRLDSLLAAQHLPVRQRIGWLATTFNVSIPGARKWLKGGGFPTVETSIALALRLGVSLDWLLTGRGEHTNSLDALRARLAEAAKIAAALTEADHRPQNNHIAMAAFKQYAIAPSRRERTGPKARATRTTNGRGVIHREKTQQ